MCVYSMIVDHTYDMWKKRLTPIQPTQFPNPRISSEEIEEFRKLLDRAREYDKKNNQPDCELEEKKKKLLELAKQLGVEIKFD